MDAVEYVKTKRRMCAMIHRCIDCPLAGNCGVDTTDPEGNVKAVEKWAKEHPLKTRGTEFFKHYPNGMSVDGFPHICPRYIDTTFKCDVAVCGIDCEEKYWTEEIE